jgi:hypothetical protein
MEWLDVLARHGVRAHLIEVADPAEETFPYAGRTEFVDPETGEKLTAGRAETLGDEYRSHYSARRAELAGWCAGSAGASRSTTPTGSRRRRWSGSIWRRQRPCAEGGAHELAAAFLRRAADAGRPARPAGHLVAAAADPAQAAAEVFPPLRILARV